jgi:hypothetical protein
VYNADIGDISLHRQKGAVMSIPKANGVNECYAPVDKVDPSELKYIFKRMRRKVQEVCKCNECQIDNPNMEEW